MMMQGAAGGGSWRAAPALCPWALATTPAWPCAHACNPAATPAGVDPGPSRGKFKIYIYEIPTWVAHEDGWMLGWNQHDLIYTAYQHFQRMLYQDWTVRTENPW